MDSPKYCDSILVLTVRQNTLAKRVFLCERKVVRNAITFRSVIGWGIVGYVKLNHNLVYMYKDRWVRTV